MLWKFVSNFVILALLTLFNQIEAQYVETNMGNLNDKLNNIEDKSKCYLMDLQFQTNKLDVIIENQNKNISYPVSEPSNCIEATKLTRECGIYEIVVPKFNKEPFEVYCNEDIDFGGWTEILRRFDGSVDFNQNWIGYKEGFGDLRGEFFIGLEKIHALTTLGPKHELYIAMENFDGEKKYAKYDAFVIGSEDEDYSINELGIFRGDVSDALRNHEHQKFSTIDRDNDSENGNCADVFESGWWFTGCFSVLFTGLYEFDNIGRHFIKWKNFDAENTWAKLKSVQMMIRPRTS